MMKAAFDRKFQRVCSLVISLVLLVSMATPISAIPASAAVNFDQNSNVNFAGSAGLQQVNASPACPATTWSMVSEPNISMSSSLGTGRSEFDWWWVNAHRGFEAQTRTFAGEISLLNCILDPDCKILEVLKDLFFASSEAYGDAMIHNITLRLEGPSDAQAVVRTSGSMDGLLLGAAVGLAEARAKVASTLSLQYPGGSRQLVSVDRTEYAYLLEQFSQHIQGSGSGPGAHSFLLDVGSEVHFSGRIRSEASSISTASGVSASVSFFQNVYPTSEVDIPGLRITADVLNTIPKITANQSAVTVNEGQIASNQGVFCDGDSDVLTLSASVGTITRLPDGTWNWTYSTKNGPQESQTVTITADDGKNGISRTTFNLVVNNVPPTVNAGPDQKVFRFDMVGLLGSWLDPAGHLDDPYNWTWDINGDGTSDLSGVGAYGNAIPASTQFALPGFYTLTFQVTDKDGGAGSDAVTVEVVNRPPVCSNAAPSVLQLWPPEHHFMPVQVLNITDPENDPINVRITNIFQDEAVDSRGSGNTSPDAQGIGTSVAWLRAERSALYDGRVYHIRFLAADSFGGQCTGEVLVGVPLSEKSNPVDNGSVYDSTKILK